MRFRIVLLACAVALLLASPAAAQSGQIAPPGNSGVDEYLETVPTPEGNRPSRGDDGDGGGTARGPALSREARRRLEDSGPDGKRAAALAEATAPRPARSGRSAELEKAGEGKGAVGAVVDRVVGADDDGMGAWLPILLGVTLAGAVAIAVIRRRRGVA